MFSFRGSILLFILFDRYETHSERGPRDFNRRGEEHRTFREERPPRESRLRDDRRGPPRHDSRSEWKSERGDSSDIAVYLRLQYQAH